MPPAPCSREEPPTGAPATAPLPRSLLQPRRCLKRCSRPPAAYPQARLPLPAPPPRAPPDVRLTAPQSPPTQSGSPGSSLDDPSAPKTLRCRFLNTFLNPPFGTSARPAPCCMDSAGTFLPSCLHASNTHVRLLLLRYKSLRLPLPQQDLVHYPRHIRCHCSTVVRWAPFPPPAVLRHSASCRRLEPQPSFPSAHNDSEPDTLPLFV